MDAFDPTDRHEPEPPPAREGPPPTEADMARMAMGRRAEAVLIELTQFDWPAFLRAQARFAVAGGLFLAASCSLVAWHFGMPDRVLVAACLGLLWAPVYFGLFVGFVALLRYVRIRTAVKAYCRARSIPLDRMDDFMKRTRTPSI